MPPDGIASYRPSVSGVTHMVSSGHYLAAAAGYRILEQGGLSGRLMVDASHANSQKDHRRQVGVCADIAGQVAAGEDKIMGVMIESNLVAGRQNLGGDLVYGQSVTDACIGWEETVACLEQLAEAVAKRDRQRG